MNKNNLKIELETILEYRDGQEFVDKMNTNEIPAMLAWRIIETLNKTIIDYYKEEAK